MQSSLEAKAYKYSWAMGVQQVFNTEKGCIYWKLLILRIDVWIKKKSPKEENLSMN